MDKKRSTIGISWPQIINLLSELTVFNQYDFNHFLQKMIKVISDVIPTDSCLIYLYDKQKKQLILIASKKPHPDEIGKITMEIGEGITGWVAQHQQIVAIEKESYKDTRFKPFKELPEDRYESFLSVPIRDEHGIIGVVNLQNRLPFTFSEETIRLIEALVKIIASAFAQVVLERRISTLESQLEERKIIEKAKGIIMKQKSLSENEAYQFLRTEAMKKRKSLKEIANAVILIFQ